MSNDFGKPRACNHGCSTTIYFDKNSPTGHPSPDKWLPLEIKEGRRTDVVHNCPKRNNNGTLDAAATAKASTTTAAIIDKPDSLEFAESLIEILQDYIRLKIVEQSKNK